MAAYIEQPGFISSLQHGVMKISLVGSGGCSSCHKSLCMLRDTSQREVVVPFTQQALQVGDEVLIRMRPSTGYAAVLWLYVIPFVLMVLVMIMMLMFDRGEGIAGLSALLSLVPYYGFLLLGRKYFQKQCQFEVVKQ
ncbi:MAG: SoxR reducing system RseC family protein [Cyclobacteriaceae bacterium]|nr:SoxR reducing system RseC family protein [Cyclobacteriaceae bacterium]UYN87957.1 MAG: SoxR reducing system RseC family protein [Cyclobacteriaceae bacterium]